MIVHLIMDCDLFCGSMFLKCLLGTCLKFSVNVYSQFWNYHFLGTSKMEERELEPWDPTDESSAIANGLDSSLDLDPAANGWDADDMFRTNEQAYGVQTTYDHSLRQYTVPLVKREDSPEYKEDEKRAEKIAMEIENQPASKSRAELEDMDEEAAFASVQRPPQREQDPASTNGNLIFNYHKTGYFAHVLVVFRWLLFDIKNHNFFAEQKNVSYDY